MAFKYEIYKKSFTASPDTLITTFNKRDELQYILQEIGFGDCKSRYEDDTLLYYKGRTNAIYIKYVKY